MGSRSIRIALAIIFLIAFLASYNCILIDMMSTYIVDPYDMVKYLIRTYSAKVMVFSAYAVTNCIMISNYQSRFEYEFLLTGIFSIIFITVTTFLHYTHILIMPSQWNLILFNGTTIVYFLIIYIEGRRNDLFKIDG